MEKEKNPGSVSEIAKQLLNFISALPMGMHLYELQAENRLVFQDFNPAADRILGIDHHSLIGKTIEEAFPPLADSEIPERYRKVAKTGKGWTTEQVNYHDQQISGAFEVFAFQIRQGMMVAMFNDITERKRVEESLKISEKKFRQLFEFSNDAIYIIYNRKFELINQKFQEMFNVTPEEVKRPDFNFLKLVAPKSRKFMMEHIRIIERGEKPESQFYFTALTSEGQEVDVEASVAYLDHKDGIAIQGVLRDLSSRREFDRRLRQVQKLEALGTLAGGIAHDFNNILMGIMGRCSLVLMDSNLPSQVRENLEGIEAHVKSATELTKQLLGVARGGKFQVRPVNINGILKRNADVFRRTRKEINVHEEYLDDIRTVEVDPGQMDQVLLNLLVNAGQAMPDGGDLFLKSENVELDVQFTRQFQAKPGDYVKISVVDTGHGIDEAIRDRIFDPFFTTKKMSRGTGLGLAMVYGVLKNHGGFVSVASQKGQGAAFSVFLPVSDKTVKEEMEKTMEPCQGNGTVLLVDDEAMIIDVTGEILKQLGFELRSARCGEEAIELFKADPRGIDLIVLDMIMPGLSGAETFKRLKAIDPEVKVLFSSGYSLDKRASDLLDQGCGGFIQKPFRTEELCEKINEILKS
jgi:two-component system cell cycle sensor histidine kinase/response regulator CckA